MVNYYKIIQTVVLKAFIHKLWNTLFMSSYEPYEVSVNVVYPNQLASDITNIVK